MTKIDVFSGFLGAGKTTLIKKLIAEAYKGEKIVLIENEFGEIGIDGGFMKDAGIEITEMNSGCICCSLVGDFSAALRKVITEMAPDRILIEPSGVGKLSDVIRAAKNACPDISEIGSLVTVADAGKCKIYSKNFGEFFLDQLTHAGTIILSRTDSVSQEKLETALEIIKEHNPDATVITTPWKDISGVTIRDTMEKKNTLAVALAKLLSEVEDDDDDECDDPDCECHHHHDDDEEHEHHHHHHHHDHDDGECDDPDCECHHHHDDDEEHEHHHHHHHDHDDHECDDPNCECHHHDDDEEHEHHHHHHHHHHADDVFTSWGVETGKKFSPDELQNILSELDTEKYGKVLRAKGIVPGSDGKWYHFDYVPAESNIRSGSADVTGRLCVIGAELNEELLKELFGV